MTECTVGAPVRATKPSQRAGKPPATTQATPTQEAEAPGAISSDEALVASTLAEQLRVIYDMHSMQMSVNGAELLHTAADDLEAPQDCERAIHKAAAAVYGALAVERADRQGSPAIAPLEVVHQSLRTASNGYSFEEEGCEAMAEGIRAGQRSTAAKEELAIAANTAALLSQAAGLINDEVGAVYASTLLEFGKKVLQQVVDGSLRMGTVQEAFFYAAGACAGALAIEQRDHPSARHRHQLIDAAHQVLNNAGLSYDCELNANDVAAAAIDAGARQFRDRPTPPIRRVKDDSEEVGPAALTRKQLLSVLEVAASNLATIDNILMQAQTEKDSWALAGLVDAAQALSRHCGGMVDTAAGEAILGGHDRWNFGPNFVDLGKAGEA
ncbi:hypothetical protein J2W88_002979 [Acidovorax delafieldii]|uniref:Uncharacterized protein n=1 Tax=Acidovorax delafieldii TaxID=47920 RepID=A0AAJ2BXF8_ACIDE|nr:hypothetical protein [Acidovorax delafieldii]MDR6767698.1 hypothetical protein [Acidovorax delafieldii]MDR6839680.1 hypothetical protein [Acidovorax delafieldii]MDR7368419.1 hypothetical protein [Acidovorax delafieldii]